MNKDIEENVKTCRDCAMAARALPVKFNPWQKLYTDFAGPIKSQYYLIVGDHFFEMATCDNI